MRQVINLAASDYIMLDMMKIVGVSGRMKTAAVAEANQIDISSHLWS